MNIYAHFLQMPIGSSTFYFTTAGNDFDFNGNTYLSGFITEIPDIEQTGTIKENNVSFEFCDLDNTLITNLLTQPYKHKIITLDRALLDTDLSVISTTRLYRGKMTKFEQTASDDTKKIIVSCMNTAASKRQRGRRTNVNSQAQVDPTDKCFELTPYASKELSWGKKSAIPPVNTRRGPRYLNLGPE